MGWTLLANKLWGLNWWQPALLTLIYFVPLMRLVSLPFEYGGPLFNHLNKLSGMWEHAVAPLRDTIVVVYLATGTIWHVWQGTETRDWREFTVSLAAIALIALSYANLRWKRTARMRLVSFAAGFPSIHPQEFFDHLLCSAGMIRHRPPLSPYRTVTLTSIDFRCGNGKSKASLHGILRGAWSTIWLARLTIAASHSYDGANLLKAASSFSVIWATRFAQLARAAITVEGYEQLPKTGSSQIYLFTHSSFFDFAIASLVPAGNLLHFLLARDHFHNNPIFHHILGIGRAAEALGMIFVDRKGGGDWKRAEMVGHRAVQKLVRDGCLLAIYPQGTRAARCVGAGGERRNSAYYTVGKRERIKSDGEHLKKGAAYIAVDAAIAGAKDKPGRDIKLIPTAIVGTGIVCPRGCIRIMPNTHIRLRIGEPITITAAMVEGLKKPERERPCCEAEQNYVNFVGRIHNMIDVSLKTAGGVHAELERRFFEEIRGMLDPFKIEEIAIAMKPWRGEDFLVHAILDAIYACRPRYWRPFIGELSHLILNFATREELLAFKGRVADRI